MKILHRLGWMGLGLCATAGCLFSPARTAGGSGTENTNGTLVSARVCYGDGSPAGNASIWIRPYEFLRDTGNAEGTVAQVQARTDADGYFSLDSVSEGAYVLEVSDGKGRALMRAFDAFGPYGDLGVDTLETEGSLQGVLERPEGPSAAAYVQIFGLDRMVRADSTGAFSFDSLPPGIHRIHAVSSLPGRVYLQPKPVRVDSGAGTRLDTLKLAGFADEDYDSWPFSRQLQVNTATLGLAEPITDFPLLVRLDTSNFNFGLSNGKDLRFAGPDGRHLAYETESWDADARRAEIWVRLDTLKATTPATSLTLYWGRPDAPDFSSGASVFSSFAGVWHMQNPVARGAQAIFSDAAPKGGNASGPIDVSDRSGAVGRGALFMGSQYLRTDGKPDLKPDRLLTISAWVKTTAIDSQGGEIVSMGDNYGLRIGGSGLPKIFAFQDSTWSASGQPPLSDWTNLDLTGKSILDGHWHYAAGVLDGNAMRLYVDGVEKGSVPFSGTIRYRLGTDFWIGKHGNGLSAFDFKGSLDEIEVSGQARSAAWIKLSFENQKPGSTLIQFK
ncbi:MAG: hypothetical protein JWO30_1587 [Fibrobacteres bacterium]|nr:hypothetical protein [Fibrobacterota bacterium]